MGERKGVNKYYPPDFDPNKGGLNKYHGTHALRERARKLHEGILIIRFEMPYNIWCNGCGKHIGMGVRYNAEKRKMGNYYTTPIYKFRMKCHLCDQYFEIQTDPKNCDYLILSGCRRKEERWDTEKAGNVQTTEREVKEKMMTNAMYKLEHNAIDKGKVKKLAPTLTRLEEIRDDWKDDFSINQFLRKKFRTEKKEIQSEMQSEADLKQRMNLPSDLKLVKEMQEDKDKASRIRYGFSIDTPDILVESKRRKVKGSSVFGNSINAKMELAHSLANKSKFHTERSSMKATPDLSTLIKKVVKTENVVRHEGDLEEVRKAEINIDLNDEHMKCDDKYIEHVLRNNDTVSSISDSKSHIESKVDNASNTIESNEYTVNNSVNDAARMDSLSNEIFEKKLVSATASCVNSSMDLTTNSNQSDNVKDGVVGYLNLSTIHNSSRYSSADKLNKKTELLCGNNLNTLSDSVECIKGETHCEVDVKCLISIDTETSIKLHSSDLLKNSDSANEVEGGPPLKDDHILEEKSNNNEVMCKKMTGNITAPNEFFRKNVTLVDYNSSSGSDIDN